MRLIPRDEAFFDLFAQLAGRLSSSAKLLTQLFADPQHLTQHAASIKSVEHEADMLTHTIIERIEKSFVTPIDREDIHLLASRLDNVIDLLDGTARRAVMFRISEVREPARHLAELIIRAGDCIEIAVVNVKRSKIVAERAREIKRIEEEGDALYQEAVARLFDGHPDPLDVIKWKEVYDTLERALDECEDVANTLESISLKHA